MPEYGPWFADTMQITVDIGGTDVPVGMAQSVEIRVEAEETEYFHAESTLREAVRHTEKVPVINFTIGSWDADLHRQWLSGGTDDATQTSISDTTVPQKYDITGEIQPTDDNTQAWQLTVEGVTIPTMPFFSAERNEFVGTEIEGRGDDLVEDQAPEVSP